MWAQACDVLEQADRLHRRFFRLTASQPTRTVWEPPADVFENEHEIVIAVALPGVPAERIQITTEGRELVIRAERPLRISGSGYALRQLEIPYGAFERRIALPPVRLEVAARDAIDGLLILRLTKTSQAGGR
jgi:HSP20 family molecular chaperone IbpA